MSGSLVPDFSVHADQANPHLPGLHVSAPDWRNNHSPRYGRAPLSAATQNPPKYSAPSYLHARNRALIRDNLQHLPLSFPPSCSSGTMPSKLQSLITTVPITPTTIGMSVVCVLLYITIQDWILWRKMPPGPQPLPLIGNKLLLSRRWPWIQLEELSKTYGGIFTIWIGRRPTVVISDPQIAIDLMEKRSNIYSAYAP